MRRGFAGPAGAPVLGNVLMVAVVVAAAYALSQGLTRASFGYTMGALAAITLFALVFVRTEFGASSGGIAEGRTIMVRSEDFILIVIGLAWLAKTAVNKELGIVAKTPLNRPILFYVVANIVSTLIGVLMGNVNGTSGFFYVLKYVEYFVA